MPLQRKALQEAFDTIEALVSESALRADADADANASDAPHGLAAAKAADGHGGVDLDRVGDGDGPPTDRLARHAAASATATATAASSAGRSMGSVAAAAFTRGISPGPGGAASDGDAERSMAERAKVAQKGVAALQALSSQCLANVCSLSLRAIHAYAARCRVEADKPSMPEPGATLQGEPWVHALDWPFVSELERARWKARCLRDAGRRLCSVLSSAAAELGEAAQVVRLALPSGPEASHDPEVVALKQAVKALSTAVRLDACAAIGMVQEAVQLCAPVLCYVALADC